MLTASVHAWSPSPELRASPPAPLLEDYFQVFSGWLCTCAGLQAAAMIPAPPEGPAPDHLVLPRWPHPANSQPVVAQDRVQAVFAVLELPAADHVDGVESLAQAEEAARRGERWHPQPLRVQVVKLWAGSTLGSATTSLLAQLAQVSPSEREAPLWLWIFGDHKFKASLDSLKIYSLPYHALYLPSPVVMGTRSCVVWMDT